jgi:hypothetical protein
MSTSLPTIISDYLAASDGGSVDAIVMCFTEDALVLDEGNQWRGHAQIRQWREGVAAAFEYTVEVRGADELGQVDSVERHDVYTHLEGNFPGGTVDLTQKFGLRDNRIATLQIMPTEVAS